jgi:hypothetical protein
VSARPVIVREVAGEGAAQVPFAEDPDPAGHTQKRRSLRRTLGRRAILLYTASCWRKARFSRASCRRAVTQTTTPTTRVTPGENRGSIHL